MGKHYYFASDFHLGIDAQIPSRDRESKIIRWLNSIAHQAEAIYLLGDIFDFWFEYRKVIPRGFSRIIGKLSELREQGVRLAIFTGNHDMWMFDYFTSEFGIPIYRQPQIIELENKQFFIGHGDGLGPGDHGYKLLKKIFASKTCQWLFARLHPNSAFALAQFWSRQSRIANNNIPEFLGSDKEWQILYANQKLKEQHIDFFVFGHRHLPILLPLNEGRSQFVNLGDWVRHFSYARFAEGKLELLFFENPAGRIRP